MSTLKVLQNSIVMDNGTTSGKVLRKLKEKEATIKSFNCGDADLNDFLFNEAIPFYVRNGFIPLEEEDKDEHTRLLFYDLKDE